MSRGTVATLCALSGVPAASVRSLRRDGLLVRGTFHVLSFMYGYAAVGVRNCHFERGEDASLFAFDFRNPNLAPSYTTPHKRLP